jgi:hypothetical protein
MLLVLGQNWDHVLLCKEVKGTGFAWHGRICESKQKSFARGLLGLHYACASLAGMALYASDRCLYLGSHGSIF